MRNSSCAPAFLPRLRGLALAAALVVGAAPGNPAFAVAGEILVVTGNGVNMRVGPSTKTRVRQQVQRNQQVMELQREGDWLRVEVVGSEGSEGWIHASLLAPQGGEALAAALPAAVAPARGAPAPGEVAAIAPPAATPAGEPLPAVDPPATIEPAAAPPRDEPAEVARFRQSVDYLNSRAISVAGVDLFTDVEAAGRGVVQVAATEAWSTIPPAGQQSYANTLLDRWAAAQGYGGPVSVQIVAPDGHVLMETTKP